VGVRSGRRRRPRPAHTGLLLRDGAMTTVVPSPTVESRFSEVLAEVLRVPHVPPESHFFDDLGADSLVMAQFCARVRKRGNLPAVSMKDIYAHPTLRALAGAVSGRASTLARRERGAGGEAPTPTRAHEYVLCGALQALFYLGYMYLGVFAAVAGFDWLVADSVGIARTLRLVLFGAVAFLVICAVPILVKWLLIGRWKPRKIRLWSLEYVRFWIIKTLIRSNPAPYLFIGTPLYPLYLRALGAKVGRGAVILSRRIPICTDLLTIGAGSVLRRETSFHCYRGHAGRIEVGPVTLGRDAYVGEMSVLDIDTRMGDGAQLGHASALHSGQAVPAGERWHGSPAQRTDVNYLRVAPAPCGTLRRAFFCAGTLLFVVLFYLPLMQGGLEVIVAEAPSWGRALDPGIASPDVQTFYALFR